VVERGSAQASVGINNVSLRAISYFSTSLLSHLHSRKMILMLLHNTPLKKVYYGYIP